MYRDISDFYAIIVKFYTKALKVIQKKGAKSITEQIQGQILRLYPHYRHETISQVSL